LKLRQKAALNLCVEEVFAVCESVALHHAGHYNARAKPRPVWEEFKRNATSRRSSDGRGVFVVGGKRLMTVKALEQSAASSINVVVKVLLAQLGLSAVLAALFWGFDGRVSAYSALLGGLVCVLPNAWLALRLLAPRRDPGAGALVRAAYLGELGKVVLTALLFGLVLTTVTPLAAGALFTGFIAAQLTTLAGFLMRDEGVPVEVASKPDGE
jgi:ATP synthase protein I